MKASTIFSKTMNFVWLKLALGLGTFLVSLVLLGVFGGLAMLLRSQLGTIIMMALWLAATAGIYGVVNHYFGYLIRAGHIAVVSEALTTGQMPDCKYATAVEMVKSRFAATNVYFVISSLVDGAVHQLQKGVTKVDNLTGNIPVLTQVLHFLNIFIGIALGYVDECCLGYTFYKKDENAFKTSADGVVLYFQNWKVLMKSALVTSLLVAVVSVLVTAVLTAVIVGICVVFGVSNPVSFMVAFVLAVVLTITIKAAFLDSYIMIKMMKSFMEAASTTQVKWDLYGKMCRFSRKFRELFEKGGSVIPNQPAPAPSMTI